MSEKRCETCKRWQPWGMVAMSDDAPRAVGVCDGIVEITETRGHAHLPALMPAEYDNCFFYSPKEPKS